ncbi:hypothetical protein BKA61DRAFT_583955 [Leptodontidium sp. MPI-SDFR-AT-0119]|nr:hypothetical protein BKA61DRAFT_583955 [Leptodontidium sp. MPI-SDFR-AT-0119]
MADQPDVGVYIHTSRMSNVVDELTNKAPMASAYNEAPQFCDSSPGENATKSNLKVLDMHNPTPLAGDTSVLKPPIKLPRRHGKRRRAPNGQFIKPPSMKKNPPKMSKTKRRYYEKLDSRIWRDYTPQPKRVKTTMSNEERSMATKARKEENRRRREEEVARKDKVMQDLKGMVLQAEDTRLVAEGSFGRKNAVLGNLGGFVDQLKQV